MLLLVKLSSGPIPLTTHTHPGLQVISVVYLCISADEQDSSFCKCIAICMTSHRSPAKVYGPLLRTGYNLSSIPIALLEDGRHQSLTASRKKCPKWNGREKKVLAGQPVMLQQLRSIHTRVNWKRQDRGNRTSSTWQMP